MAWNYAEPRDATNTRAMPCIFLQFTDKLENGREKKAVAQVFSKQAKLIDLLMLSCLELMKDKESRGTDCVDLDGNQLSSRHFVVFPHPTFYTPSYSVVDPDGDGVIEGLGNVWPKKCKLCVAHYDEETGKEN